MKIVQFKDGKYGIRKLTFIGYQFLTRTPKEDYWWTNKQYICTSASMNKEEVVARWEEIHNKKPFDNGIPVELPEINK
jgi:hypothetical protein